MTTPECGTSALPLLGRKLETLVESVFFTCSPQLFLRVEDAEQAGLEAAKNQVDSNCWKGGA